MRRTIAISLLTLCEAGQFALPLKGTAAEATQFETVEVTATRIPEQIDQVPASITVIDGDELRARGATDLRTALALVAGVEAPPGGDTGPAGAVPSFWGLHEFDAFLLVVDGIPWGGAFNPSIPTLNLNDVERIEVLKGAAPVMYGATAFVGVIHVIHYPAGQAANEARIGIGSFGSVHTSVAKSLPAIGNFQHSIAVDGARSRFSDTKEDITNGRILYRGSGPVAGGVLRFDGNISVQRQFPPSPVVRQGPALTTVTPLDANYNPVNSGINESHYHLALGYLHPTVIGLWDTTISWAQSYISDVRGFLLPDLNNDGTPNADSQDQRRRVLDTYVDSHFSVDLAERLKLVYGIDLLYGLGKQTSKNGSYFVPLTGPIVVPRTTDLHIDEINRLSDKRVFWGQYTQIDWKPDPSWDLIAGLRLNETYERNTSSHVDGFDPTADASAIATKHKLRPSGMIGLSYRPWRSGGDEVVLFADYRNTFKPAAVDFGPDFTPGVLNPEAAQSYEAGIKGKLLDGRLAYEASLFLLNFKNLVVRTTDVDGNPVLENAGGERLRGAELQTRYRMLDDLNVVANFSYHDARFTAGAAAEGGANVELQDKRLTLSPQLLASLGLIYAPREGFTASAAVNYVGRRFLDLANAASARSYTTLDASVGYRLGRYEIALDGYNLTDRRAPVTQSEFGDQSYYLLPARTVFLNLGFSF